MDPTLVLTGPSAYGSGTTFLLLAICGADCFLRNCVRLPLIFPRALSVATVDIIKD